MNNIPRSDLWPCASYTDNSTETKCAAAVLDKKKKAFLPKFDCSGQLLCEIIMN